MTPETDEEYALRVLKENDRLYAQLVQMLESCNPDEMEEGEFQYES